MALPIANIVFICILVFLLTFRWKTKNDKLFWASLSAHVISGISLGLIYKFYYTANDTWFFFESATKVAGLARQDFFNYIKVLFDFSETQNPIIETQDFRSIIFIKIISLFSLVGGGSYWICSAYFSFFAFISSWFLHKRIIEIFPGSTVSSALSFLVFPSVVFWSSGIEKETLTLSALYFLSGIFLLIISGKKTHFIYWLIVIIASLVLWMLKYYWAGVFFMAVLAALLVHFFSKKYSPIQNNRILVYFFSFFILGAGASFLHPNFYLNQFLEVVISNHNDFVAISNDKNLIHYYQLTPTLSSVALNAPWALISGVFRPFIGEGQGLLGLPASIENLFILILFAGFVFGLKQKQRGINILFLATISYCIVLCVFLALSTPNLGTLSRYRVGFLPFLIFVLSYKNPLIDLLTKKLGGKP